MQVLLIGNKGQLGKEFEKYFIENSIDYAGYDLPEFNITDFGQVMGIVESYKPEQIINATAFNKVDDAEKNPKLAYLTNAIGVYNLALAAIKHQIKLVHYSSDYVFDGEKGSAYVESDFPNPINEYGRSKLFGERLVQHVLNDYLVFRLSWVFGDGEQNFIHKFCQWAKANDTLKIADDETSVPTYTKTVVKVTMSALEKGLKGLYHLCSSGSANRYEWACEIAECLSMPNKIEPVKKEIFNLPAPRPLNSAMSNTLLTQILNIEIPDWRQEVRRFLKKS
jgi:dTDP-4-dehydrorhamnose reductase